MTAHIFPVLPIKHLVNQDGDPTTPHKLATGKKTSVSKLRDLLCLCVVQKANSHVDTNVLNMRHQSQKGFWDIFVGIPQHQNRYLIYIPNTRKLVSSHDVVFEDIFSSALVYTSPLYSEALTMQPEVSYIPYATSSHEKLATS